MKTGNPDDFELIPPGGTGKLSNPQAGLAFGFVGADARATPVRVPPRLASAETAGEMVELYWAALRNGGALPRPQVAGTTRRYGPCGVHWRSDCDQGMFLGEACTIAVLQDMRRTWNESFVGFSFKKFDGTPVTI